MKLIFLRAMSGMAGPITTTLTGIVAAILAKLAIVSGWSWLDEEFQKTIVGGCGLACALLTNVLAVYLNGQGVKEVQSQLQAADPSLKVDGVAGPATQAAAVTAVTTGPNTP